MKKIIVMLMAIMCFFAATANAAEVFTVRYGVDKYNVLRIEAELTDLVPYKVSMKGNTLILTVDAPLISSRKFNDSSIVENYPLVTKFFPKSTKSK